MKHCKYCNVNVETDKEFCPLCFNKLSTDNNLPESFYQLRKTNPKAIKTNTFIYKLFLFLSICAVGICTLINLLVTPEKLWCLVVTFGVLYVWVLVAHTILSKRSVYKKVLLQILSLLILLFFIYKLDSTGNWLICYVYPSLSLALFGVMLMFLFIKKNRSEYLIGFSALSIGLGVVSLLMILFSYDTFFIINLINVIASALMIIGILVFGGSAIKYELTKKWHL